MREARHRPARASALAIALLATACSTTVSPPAVRPSAGLAGAGLCGPHPQRPTGADGLKWPVVLAPGRNLHDDAQADGPICAVSLGDGSRTHPNPLAPGRASPP